MVHSGAILAQVISRKRLMSSSHSGSSNPDVFSNMIQNRDGSGSAGAEKERCHSGSRSPRGDDDAALLASGGNAKGKGGDKGNEPDVSKLVSDSVRKAMAAEQEKIAQIC